MENIIEKLYDLHLQEEELLFGIIDKKSIQKEYNVYCTLFQLLPPLMKDQLSEYTHLNDERHKAELKAMYEHGFKTALKLIFEGVKE